MSRPGRRAAALLLVAGVSLLHGWIALHIAEQARLGEGAADTRPQRLSAAFVRVLAPAAPAAAPAPAPARRHPRPVAPAAPAASVPEAVAEATAAAVPEPVQPIASAPPADPPAVLAADPAASTPAVAAASSPAPVASAPAAPAFEWPPSTRLSYTLTGDFRGPVEGRAQVQWLREGERYQVHLDVVIGPDFAPVVTRQMSSDGRLGPDGLEPRRYDETTRIVFRGARQATLAFERDAVQLANGRRVPRPAGVQDAVSQFVQLTWRFTLDPSLLQAGRVLEFPLALPRRVETWTYDVRAPETLATPAGPVEAVRVQPRREPRPGGDLVAEMWFAPALQYLPVRIVIRQDAETWIDLLVSRLPEQAAEPAQPGTSAPNRRP